MEKKAFVIIQVILLTMMLFPLNIGYADSTESEKIYPTDQRVVLFFSQSPPRLEEYYPRVGNGKDSDGTDLFFEAALKYSIDPNKSIQHVTFNLAFFTYDSFTNNYELDKNGDIRVTMGVNNWPIEPTSLPEKLQQYAEFTLDAPSKIDEDWQMELYSFDITSLITANSGIDEVTFILSKAGSFLRFVGINECLGEKECDDYLKGGWYPHLEVVYGSAETPAVTNVSVSPNTATIVQGGNEQLTATVTAVGGADQTVEWTSSDTDEKVTVDANGEVTVANDAASGTYTITATSTFDRSKTGTATITVTEAPAVTNVSVSPSTATIVQGGSQQLIATVTAVGGADQTVEWTSSDADEKVTVDANGEVTVAADANPGDYIITATSTFNRSKIGTATIKVEPSVNKTALQTAINESTTLIDTATVGTGEGQYLQESVDEFQTKITKASTVLNKPGVTQAELDQAEQDLATAKATFEASKIGVDKTTLQTAINESTTLIGTATIGEGDGQYPQVAVDEFQTEITKATAVLNKPGVTQAELDQAEQDLVVAKTTFEASKITVDKTALHTAINESTALIDTATVGEGDGQYPQEAVDTFQAAIEAANDVLIKVGVTQAGLDQAEQDLAAAKAIFEASKIGVDKTALQTAVNESTTLINAATVGTGDGQYPQIAKDAFRTAIDAANNVVNKVGVTQAELDQAVSDLEQATRAFKKAKIVLVPAPSPNPDPKEPTPSPPTPTAPVKEEIVVDVKAGAGETITQTKIERTTGSDGTTKDNVTLTSDRAQQAVDQLKDKEDKTARIVIPDENDKVSQVDVNVPSSALTTLANGKANLEIYTENVRIIIPNESLDGFEEDLYFRLVPIKKDEERQKVEDRAKKEDQVREIAKDQEIKILGRPMTIETNMQSRPVTLVLPLMDSLPKDLSARQAILDNLVVYIEHSDGTKELIRGEFVTFNNGEMGVQFDINKFSTFTMVYMEGWKEYFAALQQAGNEHNKQSGTHRPYIHGFPDGTFGPEKTVTRAQMAAMLARNLEAEYKGNNTPSFVDTHINHWAFKKIEIVNEIGLMTGYPDGRFGTEDGITRAQMAMIVDRWMLQNGKSISVDTNSTNYTDLNRSHWAYDALLRVHAYGIMVGYEDHSFKPEQMLTRAEAVKVLNRLFERGPLYGVGQPSFRDVPMIYWAYAEVEEAVREHQWKRDQNGREIIEHDS